MSHNAFLGKLLALFCAAALLSGCGSGPAATGAPKDGGAAAAKPSRVRLGFFANVTHAQALVGMARGDFEKALGCPVEPKVFNAGPDVVQAFFAGDMDLAYIGPGPALNAYEKSKGAEVRIVCGSAANGAALVARADGGIKRLEDLAGKRIATPQFGNTQDVSARHFLASLVGVNLKTAPRIEGNETQILNIKNASQLDLFRSKGIDAAWAPEPWASRLIHDGGGVLIAEEKDLWPAKRFCTVVVLVSTRFLTEYPETVRAFVNAHTEITAWINANREQAAALVNAQLAKPELAGKALGAAVLKDAFARTEFTTDPLPETIEAFAIWSHELGFSQEKLDLKALFALQDNQDAKDKAK